MAKGNITIYEGTGKKSGKPFTALRLEVGEWTALYFPTSNFEMEYIKKRLNEQETADKQADIDDFNEGF